MSLASPTLLCFRFVCPVDVVISGVELVRIISCSLAGVLANEGAFAVLLIWPEASDN